MPEASTPAAPSGGAQPASTPSTPAAKGAPPKPGSARSNDGRFSPKDGAVGVEKEAAAPATPEVKKEPYRFKRPLKVYGETEEVDLDEEGIARELQLSRARARKLADSERRASEAEALLDPQKADVDALLRRLGKDPDEWMKERLGKQLELESLSDEGRALVEERGKRESLEAKLKEQEERQKQVKRELLNKQVRVKRVETYQAALKATGVPLETPAQEREMIYRMALTEKSLVGETGQHDFTPEEIAKEAVRRGREDGKFFLQAMDIPTLISELGPERIQALLAHTVAEFEKTGGQSASPAPREEPAPADDAEPTFIDEREAERRLRAMVRGRR